MQLAYGKKVYSSDNQQIGTINELVIDPRTRIITHMVIKRGLFFASDQLIPTSIVSDTDEASVVLSENAQEIAQRFVQDYRSDEYLELEDEHARDTLGTGGRVWSRPLYISTTEAPYQSVVPPGIGPLIPETEPPMPLDEIVLEKGSPVKTKEGKEIGRVKECISDDNDKITHFIIKEGVFFSMPKRVPIDWIHKIQENEVILAVPAEAIEKLPEA
ncbi:MAG: PRC-barrel domain-containing protein [Verrucomicrobiota bacterium]